MHLQPLHKLKDVAIGIGEVAPAHLTGDFERAFDKWNAFALQLLQQDIEVFDADSDMRAVGIAARDGREGFRPVVDVEALQQFEVAALHFKESEGFVVRFVHLPELHAEADFLCVENDGGVQIGDFQSDVIKAECAGYGDLSFFTTRIGRVRRAAIGSAGHCS